MTYHIKKFLNLLYQLGKTVYCLLDFRYSYILFNVFNRLCIQGSAGRIGEYTCNSSPRLIYMILDEIKRINPDFILYVGKYS